MNNTNDSHDAGLRRDIGPLASAMLALNGMIGAGIFALPATLVADFGGFSPWLFLIFGALIFLIAVPLAELSALTPETGGPIAAVEKAFGRFAAFEIGWAYYIARLTALAANAVIFADYAARLFPSAQSELGRAAIITIVIAVIAAPNIAGVKRAAAALNVLSALKALPLVALGVAAIAAAGGLAPASPPPAEHYGPAALLILYAFVGFEAILMPAGETRRAESVIPRALLIVIGGTALFYFLVVAGYAAVMGDNEATSAPLASLAQYLFGPAGATAILVVALFSISGNLLSNLLSTPRVTFALAQSGSLPSWFAKVSARFATPANSIAFMSAAAILLALSGSFVELAVVSTLARFVVYLASLAALPIVRKQMKKETRSRMGRMARDFVWIGGVLFCLWAVSHSTGAAWRTLAALLAAGFILYVAARKARAINQTRS